MTFFAKSRGKKRKPNVSQWDRNNGWSADRPMWDRIFDLRTAPCGAESSGGPRSGLFSFSFFSIKLCASAELFVLAALARLVPTE